MKDFSWEDIAESAYKAYAANTNNKNYRGDEMPKWRDLTEKINIAWMAAVQQVAILLDAQQHPNNQYDLDENKWKDWKPGLGWYGEQLIDGSTSD